MTAIIRRQLLVFFRDRSSVFFSLLSVFIIIGLYILFLGDLTSGSLDLPGAKYLMDSWIMAGVLSAAAVSTTMGAFGIMVDDRIKGIRRDFTASPLGYRPLTAGYILGTLIIGTVMALAALLFAEIYIVTGGGSWLPLADLAEVLLLIPLSTLSGSALVLFITSFFKSQNAFSTASTLIGTLIGFLSGIYIPIGTLPPAMQFVIKIFPPSHAAVLFRRAMMGDAFATSFAGLPAEAVNTFKAEVGVAFYFGGAEFPAFASVLVLIGTAAVFYLLALWNLSRKRKTS